MGTDPWRLAQARRARESVRRLTNHRENRFISAMQAPFAQTSRP